MKVLLVLILFLLFFQFGCTEMPKDTLTINNKTILQLKIQSRMYKTSEVEKVYVGCCDLIAEMGFLLDESDPKLGLIKCSKIRTAVKESQQFMSFLSFITGNGFEDIDYKQKMSASIFIRPKVGNPNIVIVKINFQRVVWDTNEDITESILLTNPKIYEEFFTKLSKTILLESNLNEN